MQDHAAVTLIGGKFRWDDPFLIEEQLTDEERLICDTARQYAQEKLAPRVRDWNRREHFDPMVMREMGELGFLGAQLDGYGCSGIGYVAY
ncbi:MAG TPA: acyl-CoA dehydrogenase family protein, partial [Burkholderiales bacterium]|nr:acyl-CoA dehydrogenase family protein [Burkholderiales bacterium]